MCIYIYIYIYIRAGGAQAGSEIEVLPAVPSSQASCVLVDMKKLCASRASMSLMRIPFGELVIRDAVLFRTVLAARATPKRRAP